MVNGVLFMSTVVGALPCELTGPSFLLDVCSVRELDQWRGHREINLVIESTLVPASWAWRVRWLSVEDGILLARCVLWSSVGGSCVDVVDL